MSVGLYKMFDNFWTESMLVKPEDGRKVVCHPTAWDMGNREDFRWDSSTFIHMQPPWIGAGAESSLILEHMLTFSPV